MSRLPAICLFCLPLTICAASAPPAATHPLTIAAANLSNNTRQAYEDPGIRLLQALDPDVVAIQEFNYRHGTSEDLARRILGPQAYFSREKGGVRLPNGIVSKYPILDHGQWEDPYILNRNFSWATLDIPGPVPLHVVSVHFVKRHSARRIPEARHLLQLIRDHFPEDDYIALCGDFNTSTRNAEALAVLTEWLVDDPRPADQHGNPATNSRRSRPYDFVLPNPALARHHVSTSFGGLEFPGGLVFDPRLWNPVPSPALSTDADQLQHLPVLKTFQIPLD